MSQQSLSSSPSSSSSRVARLIPFLKSWLELRYSECDIPGFTVAITEGGKLVFHEAFGYANLEKKEKLTTDHLFRVASHSKTFAGTAVMQLHEAGKLNIDEPVEKILPWLKGHKDKRMSAVTTRQLLSHSAGFFRDGLESDCWQSLEAFPDEQEMRRQIMACDLVYDTNTTMKYSNYGYGVLGAIVAAASGQSFNDYARAKIIDALSLKNTGPEYESSISSRLVSCYTRPDADKKRLPLNSRLDTRALSAATGFYSNAADLGQYFSAHFVGSGKLLADEIKKEMQRTQWPVTNSLFNQEYGLGLQVDKVGARRVIGHAGAFPGMATRSLADPAAKLVVSALTNCIEADPTGICRAVYAFIDLMADSDDADLRKWEGRFVDVFCSKQILSTGARLVAFNPSMWTPLDDLEELEVVDKNTLRMTKAGGFSNAGETLNYEFDKCGKPVSFKLGGATSWEPETYKQRLKQIALPLAGAIVD